MANSVKVSKNINKKKIFKVTNKFTSKELKKNSSEISDLCKKLENEDFIHYFLKDVKKKGFFIHCVNRFPFNSYQVGDYVKIKLSLCSYWATCDMISLNYIFATHDFDDTSEIRKIEGAWEDSNGNIRDSSGSIIGKLLEGLALFGETVEKRQEQLAWIEQSRYANHSWTKQTSWDMPPNWK